MLWFGYFVRMKDNTEHENRANLLEKASDACTHNHASGLETKPRINSIRTNFVNYIKPVKENLTHTYRHNH